MTPEELRVHRELEFLRACARANERGLSPGERRRRRHQADVRLRKLLAVRIEKDERA